jgi:hypothetical protein
MEKRIDVTVGYKIVEEGKPTRYFAEDTGEGMCYKDIDAYKNNSDICYIPECEFDGEGWSIEDREGLGYTREEILNIVQDEIRWNHDDLPRDEGFEQKIADYLFEVVEWESIGVAMDRIDLYEEWKDYCINKEIFIK